MKKRNIKNIFVLLLCLVSIICIFQSVSAFCQVNGYIMDASGNPTVGNITVYCKGIDQYKYISPNTGYSTVFGLLTENCLICSDLINSSADNSSLGIFGYTTQTSNFNTGIIQLNITMHEQNPPVAVFGTNVPNAYSTTETSLTFDAKCYDDTGVSALRIYGSWGGGGWKATNSSPANDTWWNVTIDNVDTGTWYVWCSDTFGNTNQTNTRSLTITEPATSCLLPGTLISMFDGSLKPIEFIQKNDEVLSYDIENEKIVKSKVSEIEKPIREGYYNINNGLLKITNEHPVYVKNAGFIRTENLKIGDEIFTIQGNWIKINRIEYHKGYVQTYNLLFATPYYNYFASGILVHNKGGGGGKVKKTGFCGDNYCNKSSAEYEFNCSAYDYISLNNITMYANFNGTWQADQSQTISGTNANVTFSRTFNQGGTYLWNCYVCGQPLSGGDVKCEFVISNQSINVVVGGGNETQLNCCTDCGCPVGQQCTNNSCQSITNCSCGDGVCDGSCGETQATCPQDCHSICGNGVCELGETSENCPQDCYVQVSGCGDGLCNRTAGENADNCPQDCKPVCGDAICEGNETKTNCCQDCGGCAKKKKSWWWIMLIIIAVVGGLTYYYYKRKQKKKAWFGLGGFK